MGTCQSAESMTSSTMTEAEAIKRYLLEHAERLEQQARRFRETAEKIETEEPEDAPATRLERGSNEC